MNLPVLPLCLATRKTMIKQAKKQLLMAAALAALGLSASASFAKDVVVDTKGEVPYVIDSRAVVARSGHDLCWRTGYWTPAAAANTMAGEFPRRLRMRQGRRSPREVCEGCRPRRWLQGCPRWLPLRLSLPRRSSWLPTPFSNSTRLSCCPLARPSLTIWLPSPRA
jgi:hypothetical protein